MWCFVVAFIKGKDTINRNSQYCTVIQGKVQELDMLSKKSPCGANFPYYYKDGELFGAHYEGFTRKDEGLLGNGHIAIKAGGEKNGYEYSGAIFQRYRGCKNLVGD